MKFYYHTSKYGKHEKPINESKRSWRIDTSSCGQKEEQLKNRMHEWKGNEELKIDWSFHYHHSWWRVVTVTPSYRFHQRWLRFIHYLIALYWKLQPVVDRNLRTPSKSGNNKKRLILDNCTFTEKTFLEIIYSFTKRLPKADLGVHSTCRSSFGSSAVMERNHKTLGIGITISFFICFEWHFNKELIANGITENPVNFENVRELPSNK